MPSRISDFSPRLVVTLVVAALAACSGDSENPLVPEPTPGFGLGEHNEEELGRGRRAWIEDMHRAAPGVDWREINDRNGQREMERRNRLALATKRGASPWTEVGSSNLAGRMRCACISPDQQRLYAGSSLGGIWRGSLAGTGWEPIGDNLYGTVQDLVVVAAAQPGQPDVIVAVVNDAIRVTRNDGATWETPAGTLGLSAIRGVAVLQDATATIVCYGKVSGQSCILASVDRAVTFQTRWTTYPSWTGDIWVPRVGAAAVATIYLLHQGALWRSTDGGYSFSLLSTVASGATKGFLTGSEAGAPTLYTTVSVSNQWQLHRSTDGGYSFSHRNTLTEYWEPLCASIVDQNILAWGAVNAYRSSDGGGTFKAINEWGYYYASPATKLHADIFGIHCVPHPTIPQAEKWYFCTDGGVYDSDTKAATVNNLSLSGLGVSQYYSTLTSVKDPTIILAGSQDQGYQRGVWQPPLPSGPATPFTQHISGDYGHLTSGDGTHDYVYCVYPGFVLIQVGELLPKLYTAGFPAGASTKWMPALAADPMQKTSFFFCADQLWRYDKTGPSTWTPTLHSNTSFTSGGAKCLSALAFAPSNPQRVYAVNDLGYAYLSTDHGVTWTTPLKGAPAGQFFYGQAIAVNPADPLECFIGGSGYSTSPIIWTGDGGQTWQPISGGLPSTMVNGLAFAGDGSGDVYAATEAGAYWLDRPFKTWQNIMGTEAPITNYWCVEAVPAKGLMRFGTYGRGIWDYAICAGSATPYGAGCAGAGGVVPVLAMTGCSTPCGTVELSLEKGVGGGTALLFFGWTQGSTTLPNGCTLLVSPLLPLSFSVKLGGVGIGVGEFHIPATIPATAKSGSLTVQAVILDPFMASGYSATNGIEVVIQ